LVDALNKPLQEKFVRFEGLNTADSNKPVVIEVFRFSTDPLKELGLISSDIQKFTLDGTILSDSLQTGSKYFRERLLA
jgi:hypothetical protein